jgi:hypothetical protein
MDRRQNDGALRGAEKVKAIARTLTAGSPGLGESLGAAD